MLPRPHKCPHNGDTRRDPAQTPAAVFTHVNTPAMFTYVDTPAMFTYVDIMDQLNARTVALLGKAVRQLRGARALTQGELAERAGVSRTWLSQLESGTRRNAELAAVLSVLDVLGARLTLTIDEEGKP